MVIPTKVTSTVAQVVGDDIGGRDRCHQDTPEGAILVSGAEVLLTLKTTIAPWAHQT